MTTSCPHCAAPLPYGVVDHVRACEQIELALLDGAVTSDYARQVFADPIPPVKRRVKCEVCAGQERARAHDAWSGQPQPSCWACGGTGWYDAD